MITLDDALERDRKLFQYDEVEICIEEGWYDTQLRANEDQIYKLGWQAAINACPQTNTTACQCSMKKVELQS